MINNNQQLDAWYPYGLAWLFLSVCAYIFLTTALLVVNGLYLNVISNLLLSKIFNFFLLGSILLIVYTTSKGNEVFGKKHYLSQPIPWISLLVGITPILVYLSGHIKILPSFIYSATTWLFVSWIFKKAGIISEYTSRVEPPFTGSPFTFRGQWAYLRIYSSSFLFGVIFSPILLDVMPTRSIINIGLTTIFSVFILYPTAYHLAVKIRGWLPRI